MSASTLARAVSAGPVVDLVLDKMPVSITLGLWSTLIAYLITIPLGIRKAVKDGSTFDTWTRGRHHRRLCDPRLSVRDPVDRVVRGWIVTGGYSRCAVLTSSNWEDFVLGARPSITSGTSPSGAGTDHLQLCHADAADQEQLSGRDQEAVRDDRAGQGPVRGARPVRPCLSQRDADRHRRLPALFIGVFFGVSRSSRRCFRWTGWGGLASRRRWSATIRSSSARCFAFTDGAYRRHHLGPHLCAG